MLVLSGHFLIVIQTFLKCTQVENLGNTSSRLIVIFLFFTHLKMIIFTVKMNQVTISKWKEKNKALYFQANSGKIYLFDYVNFSGRRKKFHERDEPPKKLHS